MPSYCPSQSFFAYFKENMDDLGLVAPESLFASQTIAVATISTMLNALKTLGKSATVAELVGATTGLEKLLVVSTLSGCYYTGAVVGSVAVASGRYLSCGARLADVFTMVQMNGWQAPWLHRHMAMHKEITDPRHPARSSCGFRTRIGAQVA